MSVWLAVISGTMRTITAKPHARLRAAGSVGNNHPIIPGQELGKPAYNEGLPQCNWTTVMRQYITKGMGA